MGPITSFQGEYRWLSNFWPARISYDGLIFDSVEHAYVAAKCSDVKDQLKVQACKTPGEAKRLGHTISIREDWDDVKVSVMYGLLKQKFFFNEGLGKKLLATGDRDLIEGNTWNDRFWGVCNGKGENHLGVLLMTIREQLRKSTAELGSR